MPPDIPADVEALITALPKVELHVHLEGSMPAELLLELARKHRVEGVPDSVDDVRRWYEFRDFAHFVEVYLAALRVLRDEDDFARLAHAVIVDLARQNVRYAELSVSLSEHLRRGLAPELVFAGLEAGRLDAEREHDITVGWIPDFSGHLGADLGETTLDAVLAHGPSTVVGFGVGGIEVPRDPFAAVFARARAAGLASLPHAGETEGPDRIWSAVRELGARRIGHGIAAIRDPELVAHLRDTGLPLDVSPTSNVRTRAVADLAAHPLPRMLDAGLVVTLNSDDPPLFGTTLLDEYRTAHRLGLPAATLVDLARNGVHAALATEQIKGRIRAEIDDVAAAVRRPG